MAAGASYDGAPGNVRYPIGCSVTRWAHLGGVSGITRAHYPLAADTLLAHESRSMEFGRDPAKHEKNLRDRGIGFVRAARILTGFVFEWIDPRRDYGEVRINAIGMADGELLRVTHTVRDGGRLYWIITTWKAGKKDKDRWHAARRA